MIIHNKSIISALEFENLKRCFDLNEIYEGAENLADIIDMIIQELVRNINADITTAMSGLVSFSGGIQVDPELLEKIDTTHKRLLALEVKVAEHSTELLDLNEAINTPAPCVIEEKVEISNYDNAMRLVK